MSLRRPEPAALRRGGALLEVVLALALFVGAAAFVMQAIRDGMAALDRSRQRQEAVDLARSIIARLEAGLVNVSDLRAGRFEEERDGPFDDDAAPARFVVDATTERSAFDGLSLVEVTVRAAGENDGPPGALLCTLRQLVRLERDGASAALERPMEVASRGPALDHSPTR